MHPSAFAAKTYQSTLTPNNDQVVCLHKPNPLVPDPNLASEM